MTPAGPRRPSPRPSRRPADAFSGRRRRQRAGPRRPPRPARARPSRRRNDPSPGPPTRRWRSSTRCRSSATTPSRHSTPTSPRSTSPIAAASPRTHRSAGCGAQAVRRPAGSDLAPQPSRSKNRVQRLHSAGDGARPSPSVESLAMSCAGTPPLLASRARRQRRGGRRGTTAAPREPFARADNDSSSARRTGRHGRKPTEAAHTHRSRTCGRVQGGRYRLSHAPRCLRESSPDMASATSAGITRGGAGRPLGVRAGPRRGPARRAVAENR